jgi:MFS transporter, DHA1 family, inner membrane transport protein
MVSNVVPPERRGSFMSFNSSIQQLFVGSSSLMAGLIVHKTANNKIENYNLTGYLSIMLILSSILIAWRLNKTMEQRKKEAMKKAKTETQ